MATWILLQAVSPAKEDHIVLVTLISVAGGVLCALIAAIPAIVTARRTKRRVDELLEEEGRKKILEAILVQLVLDQVTKEKLRSLLGVNQVNFEEVMRSLTVIARGGKG